MLIIDNVTYSQWCRVGWGPAAGVYCYYILLFVVTLFMGFFSGFQQFKMHFCIPNLMCKQNYIFYVNFNFNTYCHVNNLYGQVLERKHLNDEDWCCIQSLQSASTKHKLEPFGESSLVLPFALVPSPLLFDVFWIFLHRTLNFVYGALLLCHTSIWTNLENEMWTMSIILPYFGFPGSM